MVQLLCNGAPLPSIEGFTLLPSSPVSNVYLEACSLTCEAIASRRSVRPGIRSHMLCIALLYASC